MATARRPNNARAGGGTHNLLALLAILLLGLIALGGGAAAARTLRRRRPKTSPFTAAAAGLAEPLSEADAVLDGLDFDAELRSILAQADGAEREEVADIDRSAEVVSTPS